MKTKKLVLSFILCGVILLGWAKTFQYFQVAKEQATVQDNLVEKADKFVEKELYIRAIPLYLDALAYPTGNNSAIEKKLMYAYLNYGSFDEYMDLISLRIEGDRAEEAEYLEAAQLLLQNADFEEAMQLLEIGIEKNNSPALKELHEANRYIHTIQMTQYQQLLPTALKDVLLGYDGEQWAYVDAGGRYLLGMYEEITPFTNNGIAVVRQNGRYYSIASNGDIYGLDETGLEFVKGINKPYILARANGKYSYYDYDFQRISEEFALDDASLSCDGYLAIKMENKWGIMTNQGAYLTPVCFDDIAKNSLGHAFARVNGELLCAASVNGTWYLHTPEGEKACDIGFSNMKAPEGDGWIAVADQNGKWGFIDETGEIKIPFTYDDAYSFSDHLGAVKINNEWCFISEHNKIVVQDAFREVLPFHNGIAQVVYSDTVAIVSLDYYKT